MKEKVFKKSKSEKRGLKLLDGSFENILSVGISTGGSAEIMMAKMCPNAKIIATTIDEKGLEFSNTQILKYGLAQQIETKIEDVSKKTNYEDNKFDFIYARLVLHYLDKYQLDDALSEIYRILKPNGKFFVVARSKDEWELKIPGAIIDYDPDTNLTTYRNQTNTIDKRQFLSKEEFCVQLEKYNFKILRCKAYKEYLYTDYQRTNKSKKANSIIEFVVNK